MHVGQAEIAAGVAVGQPFVVEAQQFQERGVQVVYVDLVLDGLEAEFVGGAVHLAAFDAASGEPHAEAVMIVIASVHFSRVGACLRQFDGRRAAEFATPHDQRFVEQAALLEIAASAPIARSHCPASLR